MQEIFHELLKTWFLFVENWGYLGIFLLMALESSIVPIPSEIIMPPAAYWAAQGKMNFWMVILSGTAGSYFGSIVSYAISRVLGAPLVIKYGKYVFLSSEKIEMTERWILNYGSIGIFTARLLPVVRHLISIPAGIFKMRVLPFSLMTVLGAFLWCLILSWFGIQVIGSSPELLNSPEALIHVLKAKVHWIIIGIAVLGLAYGLMIWLKNKKRIHVMTIQ